MRQVVVPSNRILSKKDFIENLRKVLQEKKPLHIELTKKCNLFCLHCYANAGPGRKESLSGKEFRWILENLKIMRGDGQYPKEFHISGGNPFSAIDPLLEVVGEIDKVKSKETKVTIRFIPLLNMSKEFIKKLEKLAKYDIITELFTALGPFQANAFRRIGKEFEKTKAMMEKAVETLRSIFGNRFEYIDGWLLDNLQQYPNHSEKVPIVPIGRAYYDNEELQALSFHINILDTCHCFDIWFSEEKGNLLVYSSYVPPSPVSIRVNSSGGLHLDGYLIAPILNLTAEEPYKTLDMNSLGVYLTFGGPPLAAYEKLRMDYDKIVAYVKEPSGICRLCYELKMKFHPELV